MIPIIFEGVVFVLLIAAVGTLAVWLLSEFTPAGVRLRQVRNRRRIERAAMQICPIHGAHAARDLVRLPAGDLMCPDCYREAIHGVGS